MTAGAFNKTRLAPTPSGFLHLGNVLSFMITDSLAKQTNARVMLRIDDIHREKVQTAYIEDIFDTLHFMGIDWQEGPRNLDEFEREWSQLHRLPLYDNALQKLRSSGHLFACNCSHAQIWNENPGGSYPGTCRNKMLSLDMPGVTWRVRTDKDMKLHVRVLEGDVIESILPASMQDFAVRKQNGLPSYQLSALVDDVHFGVDLIVRGQDLWPSTLSQLYLAAILEIPAFSNITFLHHALLEAAPGQKLSKSAGDTSIQYLRKHGMTREDIVAAISKMTTLVL